MAEVMGIMLRRKPQQVFAIFFTWNLSALWRRIKKLQWPWAPYNLPMNPNLPRDTTTEFPRHTEKYLRSTPGIDPYAPEIVALAMALGIKEKSKKKFAEDAYHYVKNAIVFNMETPPNGPVETMRKGYGLCINKMSILVALARLAGIPTRYVSYKQEMAGGFIEMMAAEMAGEMTQKMAQEFEKVRPTFTHGCVELFLDGEWVPADITWTDYEEVGMDIPISQFGESPFGKWYFVMPDTITRSEDLPWGVIRRSMAVSVFLLRGLYDRLNERTNQLRKEGRKRLEKIGREAYIESKKKFYVPMPRLKT